MPNFGEKDEPTERSGFLFTTTGILKHINPDKAAYDPLQYPLMFPTGQQGWEPNSIKLNLNKKIDTIDEQGYYKSL
jgi:hypothetical protein